jgi:hypothetical protein
MNPDFDNRGSKNSFLPNSTLPWSFTAAGAIGEIGSLLCAEVDCVAVTMTAALISTDNAMLDLIIVLLPNANEAKFRCKKSLAANSRIGLMQINELIETSDHAYSY